MTIAVDMKDVVKRFGDKLVLEGITFSIPTGQTVGVLGENGVGKSTLFKIIAGLTKPTSGNVQIFGEKPHFRQWGKISYLAESSKWYSYHTVEEAIDFAAQIYPNFHLDQAKEYANHMGLDFKSLVRNLSKGQHSRLKLIISLAREVDLYLLDEPFSGIDLISREKIVELLSQVISERTQTILISTHDIYEIQGLFEYVIFLKGGRVVKEGSMEKLRSEEGSLPKIYRSVFA